MILETAASHTAAAKQQNWILPEMIDNNDDDNDDQVVTMYTYVGFVSLGVCIYCV